MIQRPRLDSTFGQVQVVKYVFNPKQRIARHQEFYARREPGDLLVYIKGILAASFQCPVAGCVPPERLDALLDIARHGRFILSVSCTPDVPTEPIIRKVRAASNIGRSDDRTKVCTAHYRAPTTQEQFRRRLNIRTGAVYEHP